MNINHPITKVIDLRTDCADRALNNICFTILKLKIMPTFKLTAKQTISGGQIPKGTTFQVLIPNGTCLDSNKIREAVKQQFGKDIPANHLYVNYFDVVKL